MKQLLFLLLFLSCFCAHAQESANDILAKMAAAMKSHQSLSYNADLRIKYPDRQDTSYADGTVHMMRDERDTIWGGMVWAGEGKKYETYAFYDLNRRYVVQNTIHRVVIDKARKGDLGLSMIYTSLLGVPFLQSVNTRSNPIEKATLQPETIISGKSCYVVEVTTFTGNSSVRNETWYINKADYFPLMIKKSETGGQSTVLSITSYQFDKIGPDKFSPSQVPASYRVDNREREVPKNIQAPGNRRR